MSNCYDYMHLLTCSNYEDDVLRVAVLLAVTVSIVGTMAWLVFRLFRWMDRKRWY